MNWTATVSARGVRKDTIFDTYVFQESPHFFFIFFSSPRPRRDKRKEGLPTRFFRAHEGQAARAEILGLPDHKNKKPSEEKATREFVYTFGRNPRKTSGSERVLKNVVNQGGVTRSCDGANQKNE